MTEGLRLLLGSGALPNTTSDSKRWMRSNHLSFEFLLVMLNCTDLQHQANHGFCVECFEGIVHPNINTLSSFTHPHVCTFLLWNTKEDILKNVGNQTVLGPNDLYFCPYDRNQWHLKPFGYQHSSKYILCSMEKSKSCRFGDMRVSK